MLTYAGKIPYSNWSLCFFCSFSNRLFSSTIFTKLFSISSIWCNNESTMLLRSPIPLERSVYIYSIHLSQLINPCVTSFCPAHEAYFALDALTDVSTGLPASTYHTSLWFQQGINPDWFLGQNVGVIRLHWLLLLRIYLNTNMFKFILTITFKLIMLNNQIFKAF